MLIATFAVYLQVGHFDFLNYDDPVYISQNPHVREGLTPDAIQWAFTSGEGANWFPVTRLSHLFDVQFFGMDSGWHHLVNVVIHALSVLLLFAFLFRATRDRWASAFVALIFALHPLHVESVAWVSERKDVLSGFFWMLSLWAYVRYTEKPGRVRYLFTLLAFSLGLMSKPMIVSLPFLLVLLDLLPLRRKLALQEKIPFFALSAVVAVITWMAQQSGGAVKTFASVPPGLRIENALVAYVVYTFKVFWPSRLAVFYPYPQEIPVWQPVLAGIVLLSVSILVWRAFRSHPYLAVGWFWYVVTLAPVIGIVQVGGQARADRYMYVPMIGLTIMLAWGARAVPQLRPVLAPVATVACIACLALTWRQAQFWRDSESLFEHAVDVTERNDVAQHNLGTALLEVPGRLPDAVAHLQAAIAINPNSATAHTDLGNALSKMPERLSDAIAEYRAALRIDPNLAIPHNNLGAALTRSPDGLPEAIAECQAALRIDPDFAQAHNNLGVALMKSGRTPEAIAQFQAALRLAPNYVEARNNLNEAQKPDSGDTEYDAGLVAAKAGQWSDAVGHFEAALRKNPNNAEAHNNLGFALTNFPAQMPEAIRQFEAALRINPDYADAHYNLGVALSNIPGRMPEAIRHLEAAERLHPDPQLEQVLKQLKGK